MARHKDKDWNLPDRLETWEQVGVAVLEDLRDELRHIRRLMECPNVRAGLLAMQELRNLAKSFWVKKRRRRKRKAA